MIECSTLQKTHMISIYLEITHHNSVNAFYQIFSKLNTKYKIFVSYCKKNIEIHFVIYRNHRSRNTYIFSKFITKYEICAFQI